jgi:hypothetical protein
MAVWLAGMLFIAIVATQNFYTIDRLLTDSPNGVFRQAAVTLQTPSVRELLRYLSSELNRLYFQYWNLTQLPLGIVALWLVTKLPNSKHAMWEIVAMLGVVLFLMLVITPAILNTGRTLDFVPREPLPPGMRTFALLHTAYAVFTLINFVLGVLVTVWIQRADPNQEK